MQKAVAVIPARYNSSRFPGKPLALLKGKFVIQHVYENVSCAKLVDSVFVATDDERIINAVQSFGGKALMTSIEHESGTDRTAEAAEKIDCDYVINVQGDEPFIRPEMIDDVAELLYNDDTVSISTLANRITDIQELMSPHVVKVVMNSEGFALYFSRAPIPFSRDEWTTRDMDRGARNTNEHPKDTDHDFCFSVQPLPSGIRSSCWYKHIGIYGFRKSTLKAFTSLRTGGLEQIEKLEQLRALEAGMRIKVRVTRFDTFGIDTMEDLRKAEEWQNISL